MGSSELNITHHYDKKNAIVTVRPVAPINRENVKKTSSIAIELSNQFDCFKVLIDVRACPLQASVDEGFQTLHDMVGFLGYSMNHKIAILFNPFLIPPGRAQFMESAVNSNPNPRFRMFRDHVEAIKWLRSKA